MAINAIMQNFIVCSNFLFSLGLTEVYSGQYLSWSIFYFPRMLCNHCQDLTRRSCGSVGSTAPLVPEILLPDSDVETLMLQLVFPLHIVIHRINLRSSRPFSELIQFSHFKYTPYSNSSTFLDEVASGMQVESIETNGCHFVLELRLRVWECEKDDAAGLALGTLWKMQNLSWEKMNLWMVGWKMSWFQMWLKHHKWSSSSLVRVTWVKIQVWVGERWYCCTLILDWESSRIFEMLSMYISVSSTMTDGLFSSAANDNDGDNGS